MFLDRIATCLDRVLFMENAWYAAPSSTSFLLWMKQNARGWWNATCPMTSLFKPWSSWQNVRKWKKQENQNCSWEALGKMKELVDFREHLQIPNNKLCWSVERREINFNPKDGFMIWAEESSPLNNVWLQLRETVAKLRDVCQITNACKLLTF